MMPTTSWKSHEETLWQSIYCSHLSDVDMLIISLIDLTPASVSRKLPNRAVKCSMGTTCYFITTTLSTWTTQNTLLKWNEVFSLLFKTAFWFKKNEWKETLYSFFIVTEKIYFKNEIPVGTGQHCSNLQLWPVEPVCQKLSWQIEDPWLENRKRTSFTHFMVRLVAFQEQPRHDCEQHSTGSPCINSPGHKNAHLTCCPRKWLLYLELKSMI